MFPHGADTTTQESLLRYMRDDCLRTFEIADERLGGNAKRKRSHHSICFMIEELGVLFRKNSEDMVNMLNAMAVSFQIVFTKIDKLNKAEVEKAKEKMVKNFDQWPAAHPEIVTTSSTKGYGTKDIQDAIIEVLQNL